MGLREFLLAAAAPGWSPVKHRSGRCVPVGRAARPDVLRLHRPLEPAGGSAGPGGPEGAWSIRLRRRASVACSTGPASESATAAGQRGNWSHAGST